MSFVYYVPLENCQVDATRQMIDVLGNVGLTAHWSGALKHGFDVVEDFFFTAPVRAKLIRVELEPIRFTDARHPIPGLAQSSARAIFTYYQGMHLASLTLCVVSKDIQSSEIIFLSQCFEGRHHLEVTAPAVVSSQPLKLSDAVTLYLQRLQSALVKDTTIAVPEELLALHSRIVEIRGIAGLPYRDPKKLLRRHARELFGLLAADEGRRFMPEREARLRLKRNWRTRDFLTICSANRFLLVIDFIEHSDCAYRDSQMANAQRFQTVVENYFGPTANAAEVAGLAHGSFLTLEMACVQHYLMWYTYEQTRRHVPDSLKELLAVRQRLRRVWFNIVRLQNCELGTLQNLIYVSIELRRTIDDLHSRLDDVEREIMLAYTQRTNRLIIVLTIIATIISGAALYLQVSARSRESIPVRQNGHDRPLDKDAAASSPATVSSLTEMEQK